LVGAADFASMLNSGWFEFEAQGFESARGFEAPRSLSQFL
jgi:hypothetical protein